MQSKLLPLAVLIALTTGGCAHQQLTNRQVAKGAFVGAGVLLIVVILATQCTDHNNCNFQ